MSTGGWCGCGRRLPLGPWPHAECPTCLAQRRDRDLDRDLALADDSCCLFCGPGPHLPGCDAYVPVWRQWLAFHVYRDGRPGSLAHDLLTAAAVALAALAWGWVAVEVAGIVAGWGRP